MRFVRSFRKLESDFEDMTSNSEGKIVLRNIGLVSAGITALALGVVIGRELRSRYKFKRRTPYDFYSHSGDTIQDVEFGVGI